MASAQFTVNGYAAIPAVAVAASSVVTLALVSTDGVGGVEWSVIGNHSASAVNPTITPAGSPPGATATFTMPAGAGQGYLIRCTVNGGKDENGPNASLVYEAIVGVNTASGVIPFVHLETTQRHATHGYTLLMNSLLVPAASNEWWLSPVTQMNTGTAAGEAAGAFTTGISFVPTRQVTVTGVKFYKAGGTSRTYRAKLWNAAGTVLASVDVATTAAGIYTATFSSPQTIAQESGAGAIYKVSIWETSNSFYTRINSGSPCVLPPAATPFLASRSVLIKHLGAFKAGDADPTSEAAAERYPVEPVIL